MKEILLPEYIELREKHPQHNHGRSLHDKVLIWITVAAVILLWISCRAIEFGDARDLWPDITLMLSTAWLTLFIYAQERGKHE